MAGYGLKQHTKLILKNASKASVDEIADIVENECEPGSGDNFATANVDGQWFLNIEDAELRDFFPGFKGMIHRKKIRDMVHYAKNYQQQQEGGGDMPVYLPATPSHGKRQTIGTPSSSMCASPPPASISSPSTIQVPQPSICTQSVQYTMYTDPELEMHRKDVPLPPVHRNRLIRQTVSSMRVVCHKLRPRREPHKNELQEMSQALCNRFPGIRDPDHPSEDERWEAFFNKLLRRLQNSQPTRKVQGHTPQRSRSKGASINNDDEDDDEEQQEDEDDAPPKSSQKRVLKPMARKRSSTESKVLVSDTDSDDQDFLGFEALNTKSKKSTKVAKKPPKRKVPVSSGEDEDIENKKPPYKTLRVSSARKSAVQEKQPQLHKTLRIKSARKSLSMPQEKDDGADNDGDIDIGEEEEEEEEEEDDNTEMVHNKGEVPEDDLFDEDDLNGDGKPAAMMKQSSEQMCQHYDKMMVLWNKPKPPLTKIKFLMLAELEGRRNYIDNSGIKDYDAKILHALEKYPMFRMCSILVYEMQLLCQLTDRQMVDMEGTTSQVIETIYNLGLKLKKIHKASGNVHTKFKDTLLNIHLIFPSKIKKKAKDDIIVVIKEGADHKKSVKTCVFPRLIIDGKSIILAAAGLELEVFERPTNMVGYSNVLLSFLSTFYVFDIQYPKGLDPGLLLLQIKTVQTVEDLHKDDVTSELTAAIMKYDNYVTA